MSPTRAFLLLAALATAQAQQTTWKLVWSDEFNGPANSPPSSKNWNYDLGGNGWGNGEQEVYTNSTQNVFQDGQGHLVIRAIRDSSGNFTSGRIRTGMTSNSGAANLTWQYGRIEARIKLPFGPGVWPAFWMLGSNISTVPWPGCGEIDILENFGANKDNISTVHATLHGPPAGSNFAGTGVSSPYTLPNPQTISNGFHIYAVAWAQNSITFSVDGTAFRTLTPADIPSGAQWVFNHPFFLILNLAIGGPNTFLGTPTPSTPFPQDMLVDYVRVYQSAPLAAGTPAIAPGGIVNAASSLTSLAAGSLATIYGQNLADSTYSSQLFSNGAFSTKTPSGVSVTVNGTNAPLTYVSPNQINFQIPWATARAPDTVNVAVTRAGTTSDPVAITVNPTAPSVFLNPSTGVAILSSCATPAAGATCTLWGNGLGPKNSPSQDGVPFAPTALDSMETANACTLTIAGQSATVTYCGAAPGLVIDQLNFVYPSNLPTNSPVPATLTVAGHSGTFLIPPPVN
jgi:uncharacterized protein (TIGR03437 family)